MGKGRLLNRGKQVEHVLCTDKINNDSKKNGY